MQTVRVSSCSSSNSSLCSCQESWCVRLNSFNAFFTVSFIWTSCIEYWMWFKQNFTFTGALSVAWRQSVMRIWGTNDGTWILKHEWTHHMFVTCAENRNNKIIYHWDFDTLRIFFTYGNVKYEFNFKKAYRVWKSHHLINITVVKRSGNISSYKKYYTATI